MHWIALRWLQPEAEMPMPPMPSDEALGWWALQFTPRVAWVDEALLLADRIIPLSVGPAATLGPPVAVPIPRPRDRKTMNHDARFKAVRNQVIEYLLGPERRRGGAEPTAAPVGLATASAPAPEAAPAPAPTSADTVVAA